MNVPVIETPRLRLRGHRADDLADCFAMWSDERVTKFIGGIRSTEQQTWSRILNYIGHWHALGYGYWLIELRGTGEFAGEIGFADFKRDTIPEMRNVPEVGYALSPAFHGNGFASEALGAALTWGDANLPSRRTVCMIAPDNAPSIRVAEKAGYHAFERTTFNNAPILFYERTTGR